MLNSDPALEPSNDLLAHIESCTHCQKRISEMAGSSELWLGVKAAVAKQNSSDFRRSLASLTLDPSGIHWTESMAKQLLSPPVHPEMLGRLGRYDIERLIGSGGMGVVFKAFDTELNRTVAIKLLVPYLAGSGPARKRFSREARAAAAVVHRHVVPIHNVETDRESPFIVMQYVSGESLQSRIDRDGPLDLCEILRIGLQVADGLSAAHHQGLVHRDIKPSNILLEEAVDRALISDFGLARAADDASLTRTGFHPGTPLYMSPEQACGQIVDARSDLFSLGSMLYTMSTGRPPFRAENILSVMRRITDSEPTPIQEINPHIPAWLCSIIQKLMAKESANRFQSAAEVHDLLEKCLSHVQRPNGNALPFVPSAFKVSTAKKNFSISTGVWFMSLMVGISFVVGMLVWFSPQETQQVQSGSQAEIKSGETEKVGAKEQPPMDSRKDDASRWKELFGGEMPDGYPTEVLSLLEGLNASRGAWVATVETTRDGKEMDFEATLDVQGGVKNKIRVGGFPQWQIALKWPRENPTEQLLLNVLAGAEPNGIKLMLAPQYVIDGMPLPSDFKLYSGNWDATTSTVTWAPQRIVLPRKVENNPPSSPEAAANEEKFQFELVVKQNGELQLTAYRQNVALQISSKSVARIGLPYVEEPPALEKLPEGYKLSFAGRTEVHLVKGTGDIIIGPSVEKIGCHENIIFGSVVKYEHVPERSDKAGYFILDAANGECTKGMELNDWRDALKSKGVIEPRLVNSDQVGEN
jgi:serine/threonine protein kinase